VGAVKELVVELVDEYFCGCRRAGGDFVVSESE
jgi:hypothetical protein